MTPEVIEIGASPSYAHKITANLWIGSAPPITGTHEACAVFPALEFDTLVLCAYEYQPHENLFNIDDVFHAPMYDIMAPITRSQAAIAIRAAKHVMWRLDTGNKVLVTCLAGRNRSGLICALALCFGKSKMSVYDAVTLIRTARGSNALMNPYFIEFLESITAITAIETIDEM